MAATSAVQGSFVKNPSLDQLCKDSLELIDDLEKGQERVNPAYGEHAKAIVLLWATKCGRHFFIVKEQRRGYQHAYLETLLDKICI